MAYHSRIRDIDIEAAERSIASVEAHAASVSPRRSGRADAAPGKPRRAPGASFAQMLVQTGMLSAEQVERSRQAARREGLTLGHVLVRDSLIASRDLTTLIALHLGLPMVDLRSETIDPEAVSHLPVAIARRYVVLPIQKNGDRLTVAMTDPADLRTMHDLAARTGSAIDPVIATSEDIEEHIDLAYRLAERAAAESPEDAETAVGRITANQLQHTQPAQVVDLLLHQALQDRASDIHIEPEEYRLRIRFRIDGIL